MPKQNNRLGFKRKYKKRTSVRENTKSIDGNSGNESKKIKRKGLFLSLNRGSFT